ncbi:MAG: TVP38/TMEM64 family protein [Ornithinimicrobium sp.]
MKERVTTRGWVIRGVIALTLLGALAVAYQSGLLQPDAVREQVAAAGIWGPVVFIAVYAVLALLPVPLGLFTILAGAVFGGMWGVVVVYIGAMLGALLGYFVADSTLRPVVEPLISKHQSKVLRYLQGTGVFPVLALRLMPVAPFMAINYVSGATGIPRSSYTLGTALGIIPAVVLYVQVGASGLEDPSRLLWALAGIVVLIVIGYVLVNRSGATDGDHSLSTEEAGA